MAHIDRDIRARVLDVIDGSASVEDFEDWFVGATWQHESQLIGDINLLLAEREELDPDEVCEALFDLVRTAHVTDDDTVRSEASATIVELGNIDLSEGPAGSVTRHLALAFAGS